MPKAYCAAFTVEELHYMAYLGFYEEERKVPQPVYVGFRLYFDTLPECSQDDHASFLDYHQLIQHVGAFIHSRPFNLIEYMGAQLFQEIRAYADAHGAQNCKLWVKLVKAKPPIPELKSGAAFIMTDLESGAELVEVA